MSVYRLLNYPIVLHTRVEDGEDAWGSPVYKDVDTHAKCYYRQLSAGDADYDAEVPYEQIEVFLDPDIVVASIDSVTLDLAGRTTELEVLGQPAPELNARTGKVNHLRFVTRKAAP